MRIAVMHASVCAGEAGGTTANVTVTHVASTAAITLFVSPNHAYLRALSTTIEGGVVCAGSNTSNRAVLGAGLGLSVGVAQAWPSQRLLVGGTMVATLQALRPHYAGTLAGTRS